MLAFDWNTTLLMSYEVQAFAKPIKINIGGPLLAGFGLLNFLFFFIIQVRG